MVFVQVVKKGLSMIQLKKPVINVLMDIIWQDRKIPVKFVQSNAKHVS